MGRIGHSDESRNPEGWERVVQSEMTHLTPFDSPLSNWVIKGKSSVLRIP